MKIYFLIFRQWKWNVTNKYGDVLKIRAHRTKAMIKMQINAKLSMSRSHNGKEMFC